MKLANIIQEAPDDVYYLGLVNGKKITSQWEVTSDLSWAKKQADAYSKKHSADDISVIKILPGEKIGGGHNKVVYKIKGRVTEEFQAPAPIMKNLRVVTITDGEGYISEVFVFPNTTDASEFVNYIKSRGLDTGAANPVNIHRLTDPNQYLEEQGMEDDFSE